MAEYDNQVLRGSAQTDTAMDAGLRAYMIKIYNYMLLGLLVTAAVAYGTFMTATTQDASQAVAKLHNGVMITQFGMTLYGSPLQWVVIFSPVVLALILQASLPRISVNAARIGFLAFAALMGVSLSSIFIIYTAGSITNAFLVTAIMFGGMSLFGYTTKSDLTKFGSFLIMGVWGIVAASVVNIFLKSDALSLAFSVAGVVVFTGITAYYTQRLKDMYSASDDGTVSGRKAIMGAIVLYITFINLFTSLLRLMGGSRR